MVYEWKTASCIKTDPNIAGAVCEELRRNGELTAKNLLDASRPTEAPLHDEFEWNDGKAAEKYREGQARHIIQCLVVRTEQQQPVRAYFSIERKKYEPVDVIMQSVNSRQKLLDAAKKELETFKRKYNTLVELAGVFEAINAL